MNSKLLYLFFFLQLQSFSQEEDNISEAFNKLSSVYYYNDLKIEASKKYNFKPGEIPKYDDATYTQRINQLAASSPFNFTYNSVVRKHIDRYTKNIRSVSTILSLSKLYFPLYEKYLVQAGVPVELKYLSIVESALNPTAKSHCGAAGLWQFMYGTAKGLKLEVNSYIDERFDPEKETIAACQYLKDLHDIYGDWSLAIAAYNCGPGNVNKGIRKAGKKDFWAIYEYLPKETQGYVPAFIAVSYIMNFHEEHNMVEGDTKFLFDELDNITITKKYSLDDLANKLQMNPKELKYLNPKYYVGFVPGNNDQVIVPKNKALDWIDIEKGALPQKHVVASVKQLSNARTQEEPNGPNKTSAPEITKKSIFGTHTSKGSNIQIYSSNYDKYLKGLKESQTIILDIIGNQKVINYTAIKLRNTTDCVINKISVPKNSTFSGTIVVANGSAFIKITSVMAGGKKYEINFEADLDGGEQTKSVEDGYSIYLKI